MTNFAARAPYSTVGATQREAVERLLSADLAPAVMRVGIYVISRLASYSRLAEPARLSEIVEATGLVRETVSRSLKKLAALGIIGWRGVRAGGSWIALAPQFLPVGDVTEADTSDVTTVVTTEREVLNEETTERESAAPESDEPLTPAEMHEVDSGFAAVALSDHLFHGKPDPAVRMVALRHFRGVAPGRVREVLDLALQGVPARQIDSPKAYVGAWIANAQEELATFDRVDPDLHSQQLLTTSVG